MGSVVDSPTVDSPWVSVDSLPDGGRRAWEVQRRSSCRCVVPMGSVAPGGHLRCASQLLFLCACPMGSVARLALVPYAVQ